MTVKKLHESGLYYEVVDKPWFGPRKRGKGMLLNSPLYGEELEPKAFIEYLEHTYKDYFPYIEWIRFHRCLYRERDGESWRQRFAICNTRPDYGTRSILHEDGLKITSETGWYPLTMGRRLKGWRAQKPIWLATQERFSKMQCGQSYGAFQNINSLDVENQGCSFLLSFKNQNIILDFGFEYALKSKNLLPSFGVLTHTHLDHSGGVSTALQQEIPIFLSESVYWQLHTLGRINGCMELLFVVRPPAKFTSVDGTVFDFLPGAHSPGSMMVLITTNSNEQLLYPGDYCLSNAYYQQNPQDLLGVFSANTFPRWLLVDSTFLGHGPTNSSEQDLEQVKQMLTAKYKHDKTVIFTALSYDYLYSVYIWLFQLFYRGEKTKINRWLIVEDDLFRLMTSTFGPFILRKHQQYDPFLEAILKSGMSNYLESVHLYTMSSGVFPDGLPGPYDIFCNFELLPSILQQTGKDVSLIAIGEQNPIFRQILSECTDNTTQVYSLDGPDFSFHSSGKAVSQIVQAAIKEGVHPIAFHNFPKRIQKALESFGISKDQYRCLFSRNVDL